MTRNELSQDEQAIFDMGYAKAVLDRREQDRAETMQLFKQCTRTPEQTLAHYRKQLELSEQMKAQVEFMEAL